jgi:hypothetical protein
MGVMDSMYGSVKVSLGPAIEAVFRALADHVPHPTHDHSPSTSWPRSWRSPRRAGRLPPPENRPRGRGFPPEALMFGVRTGYPTA